MASVRQMRTLFFSRGDLQLIILSQHEGACAGHDGVQVGRWWNVNDRVGAIPKTGTGDHDVRNRTIGNLRLCRCSVAAGIAKKNGRGYRVAAARRNQICPDNESIGDNRHGGGSSVGEGDAYSWNK